MYNAHALMDDPYIGSIRRGSLSCDCYGPGPDPWGLHKVMVQLSFLPMLMAALIANSRSVPYLLAWGVYFFVQAIQGQFTMNLQVKEIWSDAIILCSLMLTAFLWDKWTPIKQEVMRIIHMKP